MCVPAGRTLHETHRTWSHMASDSALKGVSAVQTIDKTLLRLWCKVPQTVRGATCRGRWSVRSAVVKKNAGAGGGHGECANAS